MESRWIKAIHIVLALEAKEKERWIRVPILPSSNLTSFY
jgi:hypothetical protein